MASQATAEAEVVDAAEALKPLGRVRQPQAVLEEAAVSGISVATVVMGAMPSWTATRRRPPSAVMAVTVAGSVASEEPAASRQRLAGVLP